MNGKNGTDLLLGPLDGLGDGLEPLGFLCNVEGRADRTGLAALGAEGNLLNTDVCRVLCRLRGEVILHLRIELGNSSRNPRPTGPETATLSQSQPSYLCLPTSR
jgi:hypothetical protein